MSLLDTDVEVSLGGSNVNYFEKLGYLIPREKRKNYLISVPRGTKILVKVEDLQKFSSVKVNCQCDNCGKKLYISYCDYTIQNIDGKNYCVKCSHQLYSVENGRKTKMSKTITLYQWCKDEDKEFAFDLWSDKNLDFLDNYSWGSSKAVWWKCENGIHEDYKRNINESANKNFRCSKCVQERTESFLQETVRKYLMSVGFKVYTEHDCSIIFKNNKYKNGWGKMPYDNEIVINDYHLIIEVNGEQHYRIDKWNRLTAKRNGTTPEFELEKRKDYDKVKKDYALSQGYYYLEIPYWTEKDNSWKTLIDNKLEEIYNDINNN